MSNPMRDWLEYADVDRPPLFPIAGEQLTTHFSLERRQGELHEVGWRKEELVIASALIAVADVGKAKAACLTHREIDLTPSWTSESTFDFAEFGCTRDFEIEPWVHIWRHPITNQLQIRLRPDFEMYHALMPQQGDTRTLIHPLDRIAAIRVGVLEFDFTESAPHVVAHLNYVRDYLSACGGALVVSIVSDRFANAEQSDVFGIEAAEDVEIAPSAWRTTLIHERSNDRTFPMARSILWRTIVVEPLADPRLDRTPWYRPGARAADSDLPSGFVIDSEGTRGTLRDATRIDYLQFRPAVLHKYLTNEHYGARFHMRTWGVAWTPLHDSIDIGFNDADVLDAFVHDLLKLTPEEQSHWASFSLPRTGTVCVEMFQTRMMLNPPDSKSVPDALEKARDSLAAAFEQRYGIALFDAFQLTDRDWQRLSVGPVTEVLSELLELAKLIYRWSVESMRVASLRTAIADRAKADPSWKQIRLMRSLLEIAGAAPQTITEIGDVLAGLNKLRVGDAHLTGEARTEVAEAIGLGAQTASLRAMYLALVDRVVAALSKSATLFADLR